MGESVFSKNPDEAKEGGSLNRIRYMWWLQEQHARQWASNPHPRFGLRVPGLGRLRFSREGVAYYHTDAATRSRGRE